MIKVDSYYRYEAEVGDKIYAVSGPKEVVEYLEAKDKRIAQLEALLREPTLDEIYSACGSYRHDFGLLSVEDCKSTAFQAREWLRAWKKAYKLL